MTAAKHWDNPAKFCGHVVGMLEASETCLTYCRWVGVSRADMFDMIWDGDGELVPSVASAQSSNKGMSN